MAGAAFWGFFAYTNLRHFAEAGYLWNLFWGVIFAGAAWGYLRGFVCMALAFDSIPRKRE